MEEKAYINSIASFLPGTPVPNEEMEDYLGLIGRADALKTAFSVLL